MSRKIRTNFVNPPLPTRIMDWNAWEDGEEESGPIGYGKTEQEAIDDLKVQLGDM
ncbi:hypothetical protein UFOVP826_10 [uncultured Caudovirales phage]|uniref:Uncharacterized protein n=1 Tax=uncultured Caudovirales phage TaxID=2100421 RepID=A0A6J5NYS4_9CAUD|nr:hypothetical protein UFOVP826_10 [uncultured Caudovirales phage]